jgi:hypothetical protein
MSHTPPQVVKVRPWRIVNPWDEDAEMSEAVLTVKELLSPLPPGYGDLRAVGLNYKDHAVSQTLAVYVRCLSLMTDLSLGRDETRFT